MCLVCNIQNDSFVVKEDVKRAKDLIEQIFVNVKVKSLAVLYSFTSKNSGDYELWAKKFKKYDFTEFLLRVTVNLILVVKIYVFLYGR
jgi:hypothetical protein